MDKEEKQNVIATAETIMYENASTGLPHMTTSISTKGVLDSDKLMFIAALDAMTFMEARMRIEDVPLTKDNYNHFISQVKHIMQQIAEQRLEVAETAQHDAAGPRAG